MSLKIKEKGFLESCCLETDAKGVTYSKSAAFSDKKYFRFDEIDCILMSEDNQLSFQAKGEVFKVKTIPGNDKHKQIINEFLKGVNNTVEEAAKVSEVS